jgi:RNA polymerase sigma factor (sigma-70 family)
MIAELTATFRFGFSYSATKSALLKMGGALAANNAAQSKEKNLSDIIKGCQNDKEPSREKLYKLFYGYALSISMKYCINRDDAIEVVNDSFMNVFRNIKRFDTDRPFKPWLRKIVVNASIDKIRKQPKNHLDIDDISVSGDQFVDTDLSIRETLQLLEYLPDTYRAVFNLYEIDGYSHKEISDMLGIGESSSRTYLLRAKNKLRELYNQHFTGKIYQNA